MGIIENGAKVVFTGDSVTDCGRGYLDDAQIGNGYVRIVADRLKKTVYNRGVSGNRSADLLTRWDKDVLSLRPDVLSILIGINDVWRFFDNGDKTTTETYRDNCRKMLEKTRAACPKTKLIIVAPFYLPVVAASADWQADFVPKRLALQKLAEEYADFFVPADALFAEAAQAVPPTELLADGVHPSPLGHALLADALIKLA